MQVAEAMIETAAAAGCDVIKFQSWRADMVRKDFPNYEATYKRHKKAQLSEDDHRFLIETCKKNNIGFLTTCFDLESVKFLASLGMGAIKVASPDCASFTLINRLMDKFEKLIISTGMSTDEEIRRMIKHVAGHNVTVLHCVSLYPTPPEKANLSRMKWIESLGVKAGLSDHSVGPDAAIMAITMGASIVEKHYTLSRHLPGKDQSMSAPPEEFAELSRWANLAQILPGSANPGLSEEELAIREIYVGKWGDNR